MPEQTPDHPRISRRTLMKGTAWAVPAIAVAAAAPAVAASEPTPEPPVFDFSDGCRNNGSAKGCGVAEQYNVPLTLTNDAPTPFILYISSYSVQGAEVGVSGIVNPRPTCGPVPEACTATCPITGMTAQNSICIPGNTTVSLTVVSGLTGSGNTQNTKVDWQWIDAGTCSVVASGSSTYAPNMINC